MKHQFIKILLFLILFSIFNLAQVNVSIPDTTLEKVKSIEIPINVSDLTGLGVTSYKFRLKYDTEILKVKSVIDDETLSDKRFWKIDAWLDDENDDLIVQARGWFPLSGKGTILIVKFNIISEEGSSELILDNFKFNSGSPSVNIKNGSFTIFSEKLISFTKTGNGDGEIKIDDEVFNMPFEKLLVLNKTYKISAIPKTGSQFNYWNGSLQTNENPIDFKVEDNAEITANFSLKVHSVSAVINPESYGTVEGQGIYNYGDVVTLIANPYSGKEFNNWTKDGQVISNDSEYSFTVKNDINLEANFNNFLFLVSINSNPTVGGNITGAGYYYLNQTATLKADCNDGWQFLNWMENDKIISQDKIINIQVDSDKDIVANFTAVTSVESEKSILDKTYLFNPYPNPFNPSITFKFKIAKSSEVTLTVYDLTGKIVAQPIKSSNFSKGIYTKTLTATFAMQGMSSGIYFYKFKAVDNLGGISVRSGKLILLK